jgi:L-ascorbate metabolism protein UlaG (beta-lactamase superfamily)
MLDSMIRGLLEPFDRGLRQAPPPPEGAPRLTVRSLHTAGFVLEHAGRTLVIDPYVSRPSAWATVAGPLVPDTAAIERHIPRADDVLIGHAHHDHILDAPDLCKRTGARFIGSPDACNVARAGGVPEAQIRPTIGREDIPCGPLTVRGLPSRHGRVYFGRIPLSGSIPAPPAWPPRFRDLKHGLVLNWLVTAGDLRLGHIDSADFIDDELAGHTCDVLCLCAIGRKGRPGYTETAIRLLKPRYVVACHWDLFFGPPERPSVELPGCDLAGFVEEIRAAGATPVVLDFGDVLAL